MTENVDKAFWLNTWAGDLPKKWVIIHKAYNTNPIATNFPARDATNPSSVELVVYELDSLENEGWLTAEDYVLFGDWLASKSELEYFEFPLWKDEASQEFTLADKYYLQIYISYKGIFPRFGHDREAGHRHDYQWYDQDEIIHHGQLLQRLLMYASQQGKMMAQQPTNLLSITS